MTIFTSDLDNTLIYSYKHDIGNMKRSVEIYQSRKISYITERTYSLLQNVKDKTFFVPITTRSVEQYERIDFGMGKIKYALVCNGGVLLVDGERDRTWYEDSLEIVKPCFGELKKGISLLETSPSRKFEIRFIENLFVFTKCSDAESEVFSLKKRLDLSLVDVYNNGEKVYILPKSLNKGSAVKKFKKYINAEKIIAAGDSEFDIPMLEEADVGMIPIDFKWKLRNSSNIILRNIGDKIFSEFVLENCLNYLTI